jgi:hypothetical protein
MNQGGTTEMNDVRRASGGGADRLAAAVLRSPAHRLLSRGRLLVTGGAGPGAVAARSFEEGGRLWIVDRRPWMDTLRPLVPVVVQLGGSGAVATPEVVRDEAEQVRVLRGVLRTHGAVRRWLGLGSAPQASDAEVARRAAAGGVRVVRLHLDRDLADAPRSAGCRRTVPTLAGEASR